MQVLECHSASVAEDDVSEWVDDPDISVLLMIVTQMPCLSLRLVRDVATSEANAALRADKLSHLAARILRDWAAEVAVAPTAMMISSSSSSSSLLGIVSARGAAPLHGGGDGRGPRGARRRRGAADRTVARRLLTAFSVRHI